MKQHITGIQFSQLSMTQREYIKSWVAQKMQDEAERQNPGSFVSISPPTSADYLLSIGQMIQFLDEQKNNHLANVLKEFVWDSGGAGYNGGYEPDWEVGDMNQLCDSLFKACKEVLEAKPTAGFLTLCKDKNCDGSCDNQMHYKGIPIERAK